VSKKDGDGDMGKHAFEKRVTAYSFDPKDLVIIGLDTDDGPEHDLYDMKRLKKPISPEMVKNIMVNGIIQPIAIRKDGDRALVVAGRRRVVAARKANEKLLSMGEQPIEVPAMLKRGSDEHIMGIFLSENEHRVDDDPIAKAEKAERYKQRGKNNAEVGVIFGVSATAIANWLKVLDCIPEVKNAVEAGKISMSAAVELADLSPEEQKAALENMLETGKTTVRDAKGQKGTTESPVVLAPKKSLARKVIENPKTAKVLGDGFIKGVLWAIGDSEAKAIKGLAGIIEDIEEGG